MKPAWLAEQEGNCSSCQAPFNTYQAGGQYHDTGLCTTCALSPNGPPGSAGRIMAETLRMPGLGGLLP